MPNKPHRQLEVIEYDNGWMEPEAKAAFEAHLATCADCQAALTQTRSMMALLVEAYTPPRLSAAEVLAGARIKFAQRQQQRTRRRWQWGLGLVFASVVAWLLYIALVIHPEHEKQFEMSMGVRDAGWMPHGMSAPHAPKFPEEPSAPDGG